MLSYFDQERGDEAADAGGPRDQAQPAECASRHVRGVHQDTRGQMTPTLKYIPPVCPARAKLQSQYFYSVDL